MKRKANHLKIKKEPTVSLFQTKIDKFVEKSILDNTLSDEGRYLLSYVPTKKLKYVK